MIDYNWSFSSRPLERRRASGSRVLRDHVVREAVARDRRLARFSEAATHWLRFAFAGKGAFEAEKEKKKKRKKGVLESINVKGKIPSTTQRAAIVNHDGAARLHKEPSVGHT